MYKIYIFLIITTRDDDLSQQLTSTCKLDHTQHYIRNSSYYKLATTSVIYYSNSSASALIGMKTINMAKIQHPT